MTTDITKGSPESELYARQLGIYNPEDRKGDKVTFVGVGGIGSFAAQGAAKLGVRYIDLWDHDTVEMHNIPNQNYTMAQEGMTKVEAMRRTCEATNPFAKVHAFPVKLPDDTCNPLDGVVVSGLDSMKARVEVYEGCIKNNPNIDLYLDGRISGQFLVVYAMCPRDMKDAAFYEKQALYKYDDEGAESLPCTERGIIDVGLQIGSLMTRLLRRHFTNEEVPRINMMNQATYHATSGGWLNLDG